MDRQIKIEQALMERLDFDETLKLYEWIYNRMNKYLEKVNPE